MLLGQLSLLVWSFPSRYSITPPTRGPCSLSPRLSWTLPKKENDDIVIMGYWFSSIGREGQASAPVSAKGTKGAISRSLPCFSSFLSGTKHFSLIDNDNMVTSRLSRRRFVTYFESKGSVIWVQAGSYPNWCFGRWAPLDETLGLLPKFY